MLVNIYLQAVKKSIIVLEKLSSQSSIKFFSRQFRSNSISIRQQEMSRPRGSYRNCNDAKFRLHRRNGARRSGWLKWRWKKDCYETWIISSWFFFVCRAKCVMKLMFGHATHLKKSFRLSNPLLVGVLCSTHARLHRMNIN